MTHLLQSSQSVVEAARYLSAGAVLFQLKLQVETASFSNKPDSTIAVGSGCWPAQMRLLAYERCRRGLRRLLGGIGECPRRFAGAFGSQLSAQLLILLFSISELHFGPKISKFS